MSKIYPLKSLTSYLLSLFLLIISGCGFHLRGDISLPEIYQAIYIDNRTNSNITSQLRASLAENDIRLVNAISEASSIIRIHSYNTERRAIAVRGKEVKEYEITLMVAFSVHNVDGKQRGKLQNINNTRRYSFNHDQVLGATNEEQILLREMKIDMVNQILRRLSKIK